MTTRNPERDDWNFMHPRTDMAGEKSEIFGAEFPLYNLICGRFNTLLGYSHAHGRIMRLIFWFFAINCGLLIIGCSSVILITTYLTVSQKIKFIIKQPVAEPVLSEVEVLVLSEVEVLVLSEVEV